MLHRSAAVALCLVCASCASAPPPAEAPVAPPPVASVPTPVEVPVAEAPPEPVDPFCARITELNTAYFARDSADLDAEARRRLGENAEILSRCPEIYTIISGYADPDGGERSNPASLSQARADEVEAFYVQQGLNAGRFRAVGRGREPGSGGGKGTEEERELSSLRSRRADSYPAGKL